MGRRKGNPVSGWMVVDKPLGITSATVVNRMRKLLNAAKAGHGGTLDPLASGILPVAFGEATKTVAYVMDGLKIYDFDVTFGESRTTDDSEGDVVETSDVRPSKSQILAALPPMLGEISQVPPKYSAVKIDGQRAYDLARSNEDVALKARQVYVESFDLVSVDSDDSVTIAKFKVSCGKGTYVRALARDLAEALGTKGYVSHLRRLATGGFSMENAFPLDDLEKMGHDAALSKLLSVETALDGIPALALTEQEASRLRNGQPVGLIAIMQRNQNLAAQVVETLRDGETVSAMCNGRLVAIAKRNGAEVQPIRVIHSS
jgi:tRNA pseudouridine55 synthase